MKHGIILASKSPRRSEILAMLGVPFTVSTPSDVDETWPADLAPHQVPEFLARKKAAAWVHQNANPDAVVIGADTVVICQGRIMGKPRSESDAAEMLRTLSGKTHTVVSGVAVAHNGTLHSITDTTEVTFKPLSEAEIEFYVKNYRPLDKAGAYGIQEWIGAVGVTSINGSFYNVMGLPVHRLYRMLSQFNVI